jgi:hypothetical protein
MEPNAALQVLISFPPLLYGRCAHGFTLSEAAATILAEFSDEFRINKDASSFHPTPFVGLL